MIRIVLGFAVLFSIPVVAHAFNLTGALGTSSSTGGHYPQNIIEYLGGINGGGGGGCTQGILDFSGNCNTVFAGH